MTTPAIIILNQGSDIPSSPTAGKLGIFANDGLLYKVTSAGEVSEIGGVVPLTPYYVTAGETYTIPLYQQVLYHMPIDIDGDVVVEGYLIEV